MTSEQSWRYDAFISYRTATSSRAARQLQRALVALSKRHHLNRSINIFLDTQSLVAGGLDDTLKQALSQSRSLIVLLAPGTRDSPWVDVEIQYWLEHGGSLDRLYLVRHDPSLDMTWDEARGDFARPEGLPEALSGLFDHEQKWLELKSSVLGTDETSLVGLYAPIVGVTPEELLLAEADFQERRRRRTRFVIASLSVLLVVALVAASLAIVNGNRAEREARQARAEATAAQALLAVNDSPAQGIRFGVDAASLAGSNGVRASLMSLADATSRLNNAFDFPSEEAGYPAERAAFAHDRRTLMVWGTPAEPTEAYVAAWDVVGAREVFAVRVPVEGVFAVGGVSPDWIAVCASGGPKIINTSDGSSTKVTDVFSEAGNCSIKTFDGGLLISTTGSPDFANTYYVSHDAQIIPIPGMPSVAVREFDNTAIAAGQNGIAVISPDGVKTVYDKPVEAVEFFDHPGDFAARVDERSWVLGKLTADGYAISEVAAGPEAVDSAPELDFGVTGRLAQITADGTVSMLGTPGTAMIQSQSRTDDFSYGTRIVALNGGFVAIYRDTAWALWPPGQLAYPDTVKNLPEDIWRALPTGWGNGASFRGEDAVHAVCSGRGGLILDSSVSGDSTVSKVTLNDPAVRITDFLGITGECDVLDADDGLRYDGQLIRGNTSHSGITWTPAGEDIAVVQPDVPIEVFSPAAEQIPWRERDLPWLETWSGGRRLIIDDRLIAVENDGSVKKGVPAPLYTYERGPIAVHPAGTEVLADFLGPQQRSIFVSFDGEEQVAATACTGDVEVHYLPGAGFDQSRDAATNPTPVAHTTGDELVDCRTGDREPNVDSRTILDYAMGEGWGRILWAGEDEQIRVTDWSEQVDEDLRTRPLPEQISRVGDTVMVRGDVAAGIPQGGGILYLYKWFDGSWHVEHTYPVLLDEVRGVALADEGRLAVVVSADNRFEILDVDTGHRVMANREPMGNFATSRIATYASDDYLVILLYREDWTAANHAIEIPISIDSITEQLCTVYTTGGC